ncbi:msr9672 (plasmid) [Mesorhizobium japonicum MAFF 303099]|uniref:Msr9672 protein n=2 Tax=Mesorhizobium japonicum TaxID=2066070 RepID=Q98NZ6_RHILO|nr:msr9672 [Mesorhizobium japonicum MAFF 303099]
MALLDRVVEQLKLENQSSDARDAIASGIIGNYMAGIVDEDELISLSKPLGR